MGSVPNFPNGFAVKIEEFSRGKKKAFKQEQRSKARRMVFVVGFVCSDVGGGWKIWEVSLIFPVCCDVGGG